MKCSPEEKVWCVEGGYCCLIAFSSCQPVEQLPFLFLLVENWVLSFQDCSQAVPLTQKLGPAGGSSGRDGHGGCQEDLPCLNGCPLLSARWLSSATLLAQHCQIFRLLDAGNKDVCKICKKNKWYFESPTSVLLSAFSHLTRVWTTPVSLLFLRSSQYFNNLNF